MPCYTPLKGFRTRDGAGNYNITFKETNPLIIGPQTIACGQCIGCRLEQSRQWAVRCLHESQMHPQNCFITLTYNPENLPIGGTLVKRHFQNFMKRLRKKYPKSKHGKIGVFYCGEYGSKGARPHYHAGLFNFDFPDKVLWKNERDNPLYTSKILEKIWGKGYCVIGELTFKSAAYIARYITKKITGKHANDYYNTVDTSTGEILNRIPEFAHSSKKPAIGRTWIEKFLTDVYPHDEIILKGKSMRTARYYDKYLEKFDPDMYDYVKSNREESTYLKNIKNPEEQTQKRLNTKHEIMLRNSKNLPRSYESDDPEYVNEKTTSDWKRLEFYKHYDD